MNYLVLETNEGRKEEEEEEERERGRRRRGRERRRRRVSRVRSYKSHKGLPGRSIYF
jgi:hypothetical protein